MRLPPGFNDNGDDTVQSIRNNAFRESLVTTRSNDDEILDDEILDDEILDSIENV